MTQTTLPLTTSSANIAPAAGEPKQPVATPDEMIGKPAQPWPGRGQTWTYTDEPVFKLSVEAYHELIRLGQLTSDDKVELVEGVLVHRMSRNPPHEFAKAELVAILNRLLPTGWFCRSEATLTLDDSEPEPDLLLIRGKARDYLERHPYAADVALVIEVSDSTLRRDRGNKRRVYARAGIGVYWIVNLPARQIEVHTDPDPAAVPPAFAEPRHYGEGESVPVWLDGKMVGEVAVRDVLP